MSTNSNANTAQDDFDLSCFDNDFTGATVEPKSFSEPPDGKYQVLVYKVEMGRSKQTQTPMLKWRLKILGPQCAGQFLFRNNMIANQENIKWLKNDLATCGMDVDALKLSELPSRLRELLDVTLEVQKKTSGDFSNVYLNRRIEIDVPPEYASGRDAKSSDDMLAF